MVLLHLGAAAENALGRIRQRANGHKAVIVLLYLFSAFATALSVFTPGSTINYSSLFCQETATRDLFAKDIQQDKYPLAEVQCTITGDMIGDLRNRSNSQQQQGSELKVEDE